MYQEFDENSITYLLHQLIQTAKSNLEQRFEKANISITPLQFGVLKTLKPGNLTLNEISKKLAMRPPSLVPSIDALEKLGMILRKDDPDDRRKIQLSITKKGSEILNRLPEGEQSSSLNLAFEHLSGQKKEQLANLLKELIDNLKE